MKIAILDGDIIAYQSCAVYEKPTLKLNWGEGVVTENEELDLLELVDSKVKEWVALAGCTDCVIALSGYSKYNFRKSVHPGYKSKRPDEKPAEYDDVIGFMKDYYTCDWEDNLEGDDIMGINLGMGWADVAVSTDKDILTLPGNVLRVPRSMKNAEEPKVKVNAQVDADRYWMFQTLVGDSSDDYGGCPGVGPVKAKSILQQCTGLHNMWGAVLEAYKKSWDNPKLKSRFVTTSVYDEALMNARCARILRSASEYDFVSKEVKLWSPVFG